LVHLHGILIYVVHRIFLFGRRCLIAEGWVADSAMPEVREALRRGTLRSGASVQTVVNVVKTSEMPPTYFKSTKLTAGFQVGHGRHLQCVP
jgi:vacuolar-type H+-ATPase subunit I/STV1